jgi:hypothetical protein
VPVFYGKEDSSGHILLENGDGILFEDATVIQVSDNLTAQYKILGDVLKGLTIKYDGNAAQGAAEFYTIEGTTDDILLEDGTGRLMLEPDTPFIANTSLTTIYELQNFLAAKTKDVRYHILGDIMDQLSVRYDILQDVQTTKDLRYDIFNLATKTISFLYDGIAHAGKAKEIRYTILQDVLKTLQTKYHINNTINDNFALQYDIFNRVQDTVAFQYDITSDLQKQLTVLYDVTAPVSDSFDIKYDIDGGSSTILARQKLKIIPTDLNRETILVEKTDGPYNYALWVHLNELAGGDKVKLKSYKWDPMNLEYALYEQKTITYEDLKGTEDTPQTAVFLPFIPTEKYKVTLTQLEGTLRNYSWELYKTE